MFLVHPGGPYFAKQDAGAWTVPKGEVDAGEEPLDVALREFEEETGQAHETCAAGGPLIFLGTVRQRGGKIVHAWAFEGDWPSGAQLRSNTFELEWPPRSGSFREYPEVDRGEFFGVELARTKINPAQVALLERLMDSLDTPVD